MDRVVERLATITEHLVSFPSVAANPDAINSCADWVRAHALTRAPKLRVRQFISRGKPSLLFVMGDAPPRVLLCGHLDVVEAANQNDYAVKTVDGAKLQGRGAADMKGPIAALLDIMETDALPGMGLLLTTDEEIGGQDGTGHVLRMIDWQPEVVILPDGGANMRLVTAQKGLLRLSLTAEGRAAHGSRPWLGDNAIDRLYRGYQALLRAFPIPIDEEDWRVSITLSELHGGIAPNSVPGHAEATLDVRYPAAGDDAGKALFAEMRRRLRRHGVEAEISKLSPAFALDVADAHVARLQHVATSLLGRPLPLTREAGASDAHYFAEHNIPVLMFQPECADWHGAREWVNLESLASFRALCLGFARAMLGKERATRQQRTFAHAIAEPLHEAGDDRAALK